MPTGNQVKLPTNKYSSENDEYMEFKTSKQQDKVSQSSSQRYNKFRSKTNWKRQVNRTKRRTRPRQRQRQR